jgi:hypothetical protein
MSFITKIFNTIKKRPKLFIGLVLGKLLFMLIILGGGSFFQVQILQDIGGILEPLEGANIDLASLQDGDPFLNDVGIMEVHYNNLKKHLYYFLGFLFLMTITINWLLWIGTHKLLGRNKLHYSWLKYTLTSILAGGILFAVASFLVEKFVSKTAASVGIPDELYWLLAVFALLYYVFFAVVGVCHIKSWKKFLSQVHSLVFHPRSVLLFIGMQVIIGLLLYSFFVSVNVSVVIPIIIFFVLILVLALFKLVWLLHADEVTA